MNLDLYNGLVIEKLEKLKLSYILENEDILYQIGYKVLQNLQDSCFVSCTKVMHNGKPKLIYDISKLQSLEMLMDEMQPKVFAIILSNLFQAMEEVKNNGFIQCENIVVTFDKIFVDIHTFKVYLVYLPIVSKDKSFSYYNLEYALKNIIQQELNTYPNVRSEVIDDLCEHMKASPLLKKEMDAGLSSDRGLLEEVASSQNESTENEIKSNKESNKKKKKKLKNKSSSKKVNLKLIFIIVCQILLLSAIAVTIFVFSFFTLIKIIVCSSLLLIDILVITLLFIFSKKKKDKSNVSQNEIIHREEGGATELLDEIFIPQLVFSSVKNSEGINLIIDKNEYSIGKSETEVDGVIASNNAISRVHCKILYKDGRNLMIDMQSSNGTFLNGKRIAANQPMPIKSGDKIKLANSEFVIKSL